MYRVEDFSGRAREMKLSELLTPDARGDGGIAEMALQQAQENAKAIGALAAVLVENGLVSVKDLMLSEGFRYYNNVKPISEDR